MMRIKFILSLAWDNFKASKYNISTVIAYCIAQTFFIFSIWISLSIGLGYAKIIETQDIINVAQFNMGNIHSIKLENYEDYYNYFKPKEILTYTGERAIYDRIILDGVNYDNIEINLNVKFISNIEKGISLECYKTDYETKTDKSVLIDGRFIENPREILLTEIMSDKLNLTSDELINKEISLCKYIKVNGDYVYISQLSQFKIVGILDRNYLSSFNNNYGEEFVYMDMTSLIKDGENFFKDNIDNFDNNLIEISKLANQRGFYLPFNNSEYYTFSQTWQLDSYKEMKQLYNMVNSNGDNDSVNFKEFLNIKGTNDALQIIVYALLIFTLLIFTISTYNYYVNTEFNISDKKDFHDMMKAVGMTNKDLRKLTILEMGIMILISLTFAISLSLLLSVITKSYINGYIMNFGNVIFDEVGKMLSLNWYPLAVLSGILITIGVVGFMSYLLQKNQLNKE